MLFFTTFSLATTSFGSASLPSSIGLGSSCLSFLPLLNVIIALTSSIMGFGSLEELTSRTPIGLGCV